MKPDQSSRAVQSATSSAALYGTVATAAAAAIDIQLIYPPIQN